MCNARIFLYVCLASDVEVEAITYSAAMNFAVQWRKKAKLPLNVERVTGVNLVDLIILS